MRKTADGGVAATAGPFAHYAASPSAIYAQADAIIRQGGGLTTLTGDVIANHAAAMSGVTGVLTGPMDTAPAPVEQNASRLRRVTLVGGGCVRCWGNAVTNFNRGVDALNYEYAAAAADSFGVTRPVGHEGAARRSAQDSFDDDVADAKAAKLTELKQRYGALERLLDAAAKQTASMLEKGPDDVTTVVALVAADALPAAAVLADPSWRNDPRWQRGPNWGAKPPVWMKGSWSSEDGTGIKIFDWKGWAYLWQGGGPGWDAGDRYAWNVGAEGDTNANIGPKGFGLHLGGKAGLWGSYTATEDAPWGGTQQGKLGGFVGGEATLDAHANRDGAGVDYGGFVGGRAGPTVTVQYEESGVNASANAEGWYGYGAKGGLDLSRDDDGKIHVEAKGGAAVQVGVKLGLDVTVDPDKLPEWLGGEPDK